MSGVTDLFGPILQIVMIAMRAGALWMFFPILGQAGIPTTVRIAGALTLSTALLRKVGPTLPVWSAAHPPELAELVGFVLKEFMIGAGMGFTARWIFASVMASAHWVGMQMGFSAGGIVDPEFHSSDTSWAELQNWAAIILFFGVGGHLLLIQAMADSYQFNFDLFWDNLLGPTGAQFWIEIGSRFFVWMLRLSGPMVVVLLLLQAALGILSKFIPQINIWSVSIPVTIGVGIMLFIILSPIYADALGGLFNVEKESNYLWLKAMGAR